MILPSDYELEKKLIGCLISDSRYFTDVVEIINDDVFFYNDTKAIYQAMLNLNGKYKPIDITTLISELKTTDKLKEVGGISTLTSFSGLIGSTSNTLSYALLLKDKYVIREMAILGQNITVEALKSGNDVKDIISFAEKHITQITSKVVINNIVTSADLYKDTLKHNDMLVNRGGDVVGIPSGIRKLDEVTGGFQKSDLIILAARPGMGKTSFALKTLSIPALKGKPTAIFSLEMSNRQLYARLVSQLTNVPLSHILRSGMNEYELKQVLDKADIFCNANMYFDDTGGISFFELQNKARKMKREKGIELLIIDYLQLITNKVKGGNREQEVSEISKGLKSLAKELDIPIIALAQLSRANEQRSNKVPMLSDLRESGSIEQDADMVMFIHRPEEYGMLMGDGTPSEGKAEFIISKHRNGPTLTLEVGFDGTHTKFYDLSENNFAPF